ncbi:MAG: YqeB family protein [Egibacteraceae bacterium]
MRSGAAPQRGGTVVDEPAWAVLPTWIGLPPLGAVAGWLLKLLAGWVASLPWVPFQGPFELIASIPEPQATIGAVIVGGLAGLALAYLAAKDRLTVTVFDDLVTMARGRSPIRDIERAPIRAVFLDRKQLVLLGTAGEELAREGSDLGADRLRDAFHSHGFPWHEDGDPYKEEYWRWVEDTPDLSASANALLKARARALDKGDSDDVARLRADLAKLGIVVREEKKRQYWRRTRQPPEVPRDTMSS